MIRKTIASSGSRFLSLEVAALHTCRSELESPESRTEPMEIRRLTARLPHRTLMIYFRISMFRFFVFSFLHTQIRALAALAAQFASGVFAGQPGSTAACSPRSRAGRHKVKGKVKNERANHQLPSERVYMRTLKLH